ncbi:MAG TPA: segregation/condensation protein A [bacterium]|nr:segregation/condensation protein A [bacterium]
MSYQVKLEIFEGPLDLLLFFIQRDEIDIYDIPISRITDSYLGYLDLMRQLNIGIAGEYIRMAATLMRIKARTLLPQLADSEDEEEYEDPRSELVEMLLEYKRFKETADSLQELEGEQRKHFSRQPDYSRVDTDIKPEEVLGEVTLYDLMKTFRHLLRSVEDQPVHRIRRYDVNIRKQQDYIRRKLQKSGAFKFSEVIRELADKLTVIVTFIALLDMIKLQQVLVTQSENFSDFRVERRTVHA